MDSLHKEVLPYENSDLGKKKQVALMFNKIAKHYDFLNHFLSLGIDNIWRRKTINKLKPFQPKTILDVATGTGDLAIAALKLNPDKIVGVDISEEMLAVGKQKMIKKGLSDRIELKKGDGEELPVEDGSFDAVTVAFGVRNFENLQKGLKDIYRVLNQNGRVVILEFSKPTAFPLKQIYNFYFLNVLPTIGKLVSKDNKAYAYLPESVRQFPFGNDFIKELKNAGFKNCSCQTLTFGICSIYLGEK